MNGRDAQRGRVYAWEDATVAASDSSTVGFAAAQGMVDAIWSELGLRFPPKVGPLPRQSRCRIADASRLSIRLPQSAPSWVLLHELAHALTSDQDGRSDGHGPAFMGVYIGLLSRYMRLSEPALLASARAAGLRVEAGAQPGFVDPVAVAG